MQSATSQVSCLSHTLQHTSTNVDKVVTQLCRRIEQAGEQSDITIQEQIDMVHQLAQFGMGRYLLLHRGLNAHWSRYLKLLYPQKQRALGVNLDGEPFTPMERWYLESPPAQASQECWQMCRQVLQKQVHDYTTMASVPCGALDDLLELDFASHRHVGLVGVDIDAEALCLAEDNARDHDLIQQVQLRQADAWNLNTRNQWNVVTSKGLAGYEPSFKRLLQLYEQFYLALKPTGVLVTNLWMPYDGKLKPKISLTLKEQKELKRFSLLTRHILQVKWSQIMTQGQMSDLLQRVGFTDIRFSPTTNGLCALVTAKK